MLLIKSSIIVKTMETVILSYSKLIEIVSLDHSDLFLIILVKQFSLVKAKLIHSAILYTQSHPTLMITRQQ